MARHLLRLDILLVVALILLVVSGIKDVMVSSWSTKMVSRIAQKVGIDFPTQTNTVFGCWQIVSPK